MSIDKDEDHRRIRLLKTSEHPCSYLPDLSAQTIFIDPDAIKSPEFYQSLLDMGFRRSGSDIYRPDCADCKACISVRIPVNRFSPRRSQRRAWERFKSDLRVKVVPAIFSQKHFDLYSKYMNSRHTDGDMANPTEDDYCRFLFTSWCETAFVEFYSEDKLFSVAVIDLLPKGISAVYTFFDPEMSRLSPGVISILWQIELSKKHDLPWLYLGYWIPGCQKMEYKQDYRPIQVYSNGMWKEFSTTEAITIHELIG
jgi:arginine-tRNA-protein transferase